MKTYSRKIQYTGAAMLIIAAAVVTWMWSGIQSAFQIGVAEGKGIRVAETNACALEDVAVSDKPHFSGCNSII